MWGPHLKSKKKTLNCRLYLLRHIIKSNFSLHNKIVIYKSILRPIWAYEVQIWGCVKPSQTQLIEGFQSIILRLLVSFSMVCLQSFTPQRFQYRNHKPSCTHPSHKIPRQTSKLFQPTYCHSRFISENSVTRQPSSS